MAVLTPSITALMTSMAADGGAKAAAAYVSTADDEAPEGAASSMHRHCLGFAKV